MPDSPQKPLTKRILKPATISFLVLTITAILIWDVAVIVRDSSLTAIHQHNLKRLNLYVDSLRNTLDRFRNLPYILAQDQRIIALLNYDDTPVKVNSLLDDFATATKSLIYVMDIGGTTIATSNWRTKHDLTGYNFSFRPYFKNARKEVLGILIPVFSSIEYT